MGRAEPGQTWEGGAAYTRGRRVKEVLKEGLGAQGATWTRRCQAGTWPYSPGRLPAGSLYCWGQAREATVNTDGRGHHWHSSGVLSAPGKDGGPTPLGHTPEHQSTRGS